MAACDPREPPPAREDTTEPAPNEFDPATVATGDTVAGLRVVHVDVERVFEDSVWVGTVHFEGELAVEGVYQAHFDAPEVNAVCFHVDAGSAMRLPRFLPDTRTRPRPITWFCFSNPEVAVELLGPPEEPRHAGIVVDRYRLVREFTDAWDLAELVRVDNVGPRVAASPRVPDPANR